MDVPALHRVVLSRCEMDLKAIFVLFASKEHLCQNKTMKQWLTEKISAKKQPLHLQILLFLCGLSGSEDVEDVDDLQKEEKEEMKENELYYVSKHELLGSVTGIAPSNFKVELDVESMMKWMHPIQGGDATKDERKKLKDKMANLLCNRNSSQRFEMNKLFRAKHKSDIMDYLRLILKKGHSLKICEFLLQTVTGCRCSKLKASIDGKDFSAISDILCTLDPPHLKELVAHYNARYGSDLMEEIEETCTRSKKSTLWMVYSKLLSEDRDSMDTTISSSNLDLDSLRKDISFLLSLKKKHSAKNKKSMKQQLVDLFCVHSKLLSLSEITRTACCGDTY